MINALIEWSLRNKILTIFLALLVLFTGVFTLFKLPVDVYPDLNAPLVNIVTENYGMPPEDVERLITIPLESILNGAPNVTRVRSESSLGISVVTVEFEWGTDIYLARQLVTSRLELVTNQLPSGTARPSLGPVSSRMGEVFEFVVEGDESAMNLRGTADWVIRYRLLGVPGIAFVINMGGFLQQYQVMIDPTQLRNYDVTVEDIRHAIEENNYNPTGGLLFKGTQEHVVRGLGRLQNLDHIRNSVVTARDNVPVYVKDVADVRIGHTFRRGISSRSDRNNPEPREVVDVLVEKQYGGNTLTTIANVKEALSGIAKSLPEKIRITPYYDQSVLIWNSISHMEKAMIQGAVLVMLVVFFFMGNLRSAIITSFTIPVSVIFAFLMMWLFDIGITVMSLGGLAIGIGKMANSSIIMVENIYRVLQRNEGDFMDNTRTAAKEVGQHIFNASLIIILVFIPLFTLQGIEGRMFAPTAFAVAASLFGGLLVSLTIQPVLCSYFLKPEKVSHKEQRIIAKLKSVYRKALDLCLNHRVAILATTLVLLIVVLAFIYPRIGKEFMPQMDEGALMASTVMLPGTSLDESNRIGEIVQRTFMQFPEVISVNRNTGRAEQSEHAHGVNHSHYFVELIPKNERSRSLEDLLADMRGKLDEIPGIRYIFEQPIQNKLSEMLTGIEGEIAIKLFGPDLETLNDKIEDVKNVISGIHGVADLQVEQTAGTPQFNIALDRRKLARYGLNIQAVSDVIETALNGVEVTDILLENRRYGVFLRFAEGFRDNEEQIKNLLVNTPSGQYVPLRELGDFYAGRGPLTIMRENVTRRKVIICNVHDRDQASWVAEAKQAIENRVSLPEGYYITFGGQYESYQRASKQLFFMILLVALIVFFLVFISFSSLKNAVVIFLNVPFAMMGGVIALWIAGLTLNVSSAIGFIALFGISIQNAIILVAFINNLRAEGYALREAIIEGAIVRMRPILMTELVIIAGVLPLALFTGISGSELQQPMAVVYIGGELMAIFVTGLQLPVLYSIFEQKKA